MHVVFRRCKCLLVSSLFDNRGKSRIMDAISQTLATSPSTDNTSSMKRELEESKNQEDHVIKKLKTEDESSNKVESSAVKSEAKKKLAMLLCYCGKGYLGMQVNPGMKTIEADLFNAMLKAGIISEELARKPQLMRFQRASRTDKGVSAVRQVISLKLPPQGDLVEKINQHLPSSIRVVGWKRTTKGFDSKCSCTSRTYSYMIPTFAFTPITQTTTEDYRISNEVLTEVNSLLSKFEGTHNFHNYTSQKKPDDPSCKRYIMSCKCSQPFVLDGIEFAIIEIKGQSFMLHQIRKMVGITIAIVRGLAPASVLVRAWGRDKLDIPKAPGLGLMLEGVHYEAYDNRYGGDGVHEALTWEQYNDQINTFKKEQILSVIVEEEKTEKSMLKWLETLPFHTFDVTISGPPGVHRTSGSPFVAASVQIEKEQHDDSLKEEKEEKQDKTDNKDAVPKEGNEEISFQAGAEKS